eukprot:6207808-Pleurochrysis_carterae.AAC.3
MSQALTYGPICSLTPLCRSSTEECRRKLQDPRMEPLSGIAATRCNCRRLVACAPATDGSALLRLLPSLDSPYPRQLHLTRRQSI